MFALGLGVILVCDLLGEALARAFHLPLPGPIVGMALLLALLVVRRGAAPESVAVAGDRLVSVMPLLFVPVGVAGCAFAGVVFAGWHAVAASIAASVAAGIGATLGTAALLARRSVRRATLACAK